jgi:hypothetical protein
MRVIRIIGIIYYNNKIGTIVPKELGGGDGGGGVLPFGSIDLIERNAIIKQCARIMVIGGCPLRNTIYIHVFIVCVC